MKKLFFISIISASVILNLYLLLALVDAGLMLNDSWSEVKRLGERGQLSLKIMNGELAGRDISYAQDIVKRLENEGYKPDNFTRGALEIGDVRFVIKDGAISYVEYID